MQGFAKWMAGAAVLAVAAGCGGDGAGGGGITPTGPLLVGNTVTVSVSCPSQMETGTSGTCTAYGYDGNGSFTNSNVSSWSSSNTSVATISGGTISAVAAGSATISAVIDGVTGSTSVSVVNPPPPMSVTIYGPNKILPNHTCYWWANVSGGTPPYTYYWYGGVSSDRTGYEFWAYASRSFYLDVKVTDANGNVAWGSKYVTVTTNTGACMV
ncbi:MAG TPA: hypothetical protein VHG08_23400 [Longimicrobium sp.]|nr:hypothetical protein [Longimicrobium sp.]